MCVLTSLDVTEGEESDPEVSVDGPLLGLAVGAAAVVYEARRVPLGPRVDHAVLENTHTHTYAHNMLHLGKDKIGKMDGLNEPMRCRSRVCCIHV